MLGLWTEALTDLHVASKIDYDEEIAMALKKVTCLLSSDEIKVINLVAFFLTLFTAQVEPNAHKIEEHRKKYERLRKQKEQKRVQPKKQPQNEAQVSIVHSYRVQTKIVLFCPYP
jgi:suppressor of tumorigenicity protein 13